MGNTAKEPASLMDRVTAYEMGELTEEEFLQLFQDLVDTDLAWTLPPHYCVTVKKLIELGRINSKERR